jgi:DNA-binding GntR family transcriptional regulator
VTPDTNDPRPPYLQVADDLRREIAQGQFTPGQKLPSRRNLARQYGVAPMTINHAMAVLRDEGLVVSYQGRGVFVADGSGSREHEQPQRSRDSAIDALRADLDQLAERVSRLERQTRRARERGNTPS